LGKRRRGARREDDIDVGPDQIGRQFWQSLAPSGRPAMLHDKVLTFHIPEVAEPLEKALSSGRGPSRLGEPADPVHLPRRLRVSCERRKNEAESENEPDQPHGHLGGGRLAGSLSERRDAHHQHGADSYG
jgi:hypothetical protein